MTRRRGHLANRRNSVVLMVAALLLSGEARAQSSSGGGPLGFLDGIFTSSPSRGGQAAPPAGTMAPTPSAPAASSAPLPWSGEDGASGHPLMTAAAIRQAAANFGNCVASMWPDAARRGISQQSFQQFTAGLAPDLRIMDLMDCSRNTPNRSGTISTSW